MNLSFNAGKAATLCLYWAFAILLGVSIGWNAAFVLMCIWTLLVLLG